MKILSGIQDQKSKLSLPQKVPLDMFYKQHIKKIVGTFLHFSESVQLAVIATLFS